MRDRNGSKTGEVTVIFGLSSFHLEWALRNYLPNFSNIVIYKQQSSVGVRLWELGDGNQPIGA
jgi:hypothetical protein